MDFMRGIIGIAALAIWFAILALAGVDLSDMPVALWSFAIGWIVARFVSL